MFTEDKRLDDIGNMMQNHNTVRVDGRANNIEIVTIDRVLSNGHSARLNLLDYSSMFWLQLSIVTSRK